MDTVFISWGGGNTWPQTWWLKTAPVHPLPPLEPRVQNQGAGRAVPPEVTEASRSQPCRLRGTGLPSGRLMPSARLHAGLLHASAPLSFRKDTCYVASSAQELERNYLCQESCSKWDHIHSSQHRGLSLGRATADAEYLSMKTGPGVHLHNTWLLQLENCE